MPLENETEKRSLDYLNDVSITLVDSFKQMEQSAKKMKDTITESANEAMTVAQYQKLATVMSNVNNSSNVANANTSSHVNVNVSQTFNESDSSTIRQGIYDMGSDLANQITQATRRFNT